MMHNFRRAAALLLAAVLLTSTVLASYALGDELHGFTVPLAQGANLRTQMFWSNSKSDLRTENYITYQPSSGLAPRVSYGASVLSKGSVSSMATDLEKQGERVLSGINGDYFVMATGDPLGIVITEGILRSSASYLDAVGFLPDGKAIIGKPELTVTAKFGGNALKVADVNKVRTNAGYYLLSDDFASTTQNTQAGIDVVLAPVRDSLGSSVTADNGQTITQSDVLKIGSRVSCVVEQVLDSSGSVSIPEGKFVMTINKNSGAYLVSTLAAVKPGDTMDIEITSTDSRWNSADCAIGALYRILTLGKVNTGLDDAAAPRTAVGVKADGTVIFYTIDGRQSGLSVGASMTQVANRLLELGCVDAVCLDGGGSTTIGTTLPGSNGFSVLNSPSDGAQRSVTDALFLVSTLPPSGVPARLYAEPKNRVLLSGGTTSMNVSFVDSNWHPFSSSEGLSWSAKNGSITPAGLYTAPAVSGEDVITVTSDSGLVGTTTVTVFQTPSTLALSNEASGKAVTSLALSGKESVNLRAAASYRMIPLGVQDESFQWSVSPASLGSITPSGLFTAGMSNGSGTIQVTAGGYTTSIPLSVSVNARYALLQNFEQGLGSFQSSPTVKLTQDSTADQVRFGTKSLRVDYTLAGDRAQIPGSIPLGAQDQYLSLWVYGDQSGNALSATVRDSDDTEHSLSFGTLNFSGWKQLSIALPANAAYLTDLTISGGTTTGTIWMDQLLSSNQTAPDSSAPKLSLSITGNQLRATISDNSGATFTREQLGLCLDNKVQDFPVDGNTITATLPALDGALHRVSVTATDASGNLGRASQTLGNGSASSSFLDMSGHWAIRYTDYLAARGIVNGVTTAQGSQFYPDRSITRGDFTLMTARWMGLDLDSYASITLPFADASKIPSWSLNAVKAMYSLGYMKGSQGIDGQLYANAPDSITRAEAMTILGRIQPKGYPEAALNSFKDAASIPSWSKPYLASLVGQGVVGGFEGMLGPSDKVSRAELCKMLFTLW